MTTLKSALRFPPAHPPPPPPPLEPQYPNLTSRFSAETLLIKSPPRPFQRLFSSHNHGSASSPPPSPPSGTVKRYHRRVSSQKGGVYRHAPSASESRLVVSSPKAYDLPDTPTRASMDGVRPPRRSGSMSRTRTTSGTAADKLAGAAKEVLDLFTLRRHGHGHGRQGSHSSSASGESVESLASARPRSLSSPSPALVPQQPPAPRRRPPPRPFNPPAALVDPPPRSDSRNAMNGDLASFGAPPRAAHGPPPARPRPKQLPLHARPHLRPTSPPSPSIPPLRPARQPPAPPADGKPHKPFHAMVVSPPARAAVERRSLDELLVRIDVGGQSTFTTSAATLVGQGVEGGRLGEFVEAVLEDVRRGADEPVEQGLAASVHKEQESRRHPYLQLPGALTDASSSSLSLAPSLTPSPYPSSPFPFANDLSTYSACAPGDADEPTSPIDPLVNSSQAALASKALFLGLPHAFSPPPHPLPRSTQAHAHAQYAEMVGSPTLPHGGKHRSVYPDVGSSVDLGPEGGPLLPFVLPASRAPHSLAEEAARKALAMRSRGGAGGPAKVEPVDDEIRFKSPFERGLGPYFDVVRNQLHASVGPDSLLAVPRSPAGTFSSSPSSSPILASSPRPASAVERRSLDFGLLPSDVEGYGSEEEHRSHSTVLGVPRGLSRRTLEGLSSLARAGADEPDVPAVPRLTVEVDAVVPARSRTGTPSLSMSVSTVDDDERTDPRVEVTIDDATLTVFLDRTDSPLMTLAPTDSAGGDAAPGVTLYGAILDFLRSGSLPTSLALPSSSTSSSSSHLPTSSTATTDVDPLYLSLFALAPGPLFALLAALRSLAAEAAWLGLQDLERACTVEQERVAGVVRWLAFARRGGDKGARGTAKGASARAKEGWI
ncbi:hypothetical protein JCM9279_002548 [Rhodotorula babjevae]